MRLTIQATLALPMLALFATPAAAQEGDPRAEMKQKMEEIARLMRESERGLLDISRLGRLLEEQAAIVEKLKQLEPPEAGSAAASAEKTPEQAEREKQQQRLRERQRAVAERLKKLFEDQKGSAERSVEEIEKLLQALPRGQQQGGSESGEEGMRPKPREERDRRLDAPEERRQEEPKDGREAKEKDREPKPGAGKKPETEAEAAEQRRRINAWIARLPPEVVERLNRNDYSAIPARYQRLVRELTALRAKREAEETPER